MPPQSHDAYRWVAPIYEALGELYTGGAIRRLKQTAARTLRPGDRVLCAGGGAGEEARFALARGAEVTVVDRSHAMLDRCRRRAGGEVTLIRADLHPDAEFQDRPHGIDLSSFDQVWAHFFLNVFDRSTAPRVLRSLSRYAKPGGSILVSDFIPGGAGAHLYYGVPLIAFTLATGNAWHSIHDVGAWVVPNATLESHPSIPSPANRAGRCFHVGPRLVGQWVFRCLPRTGRDGVSDVEA
ncbi:MAG: class I SAM-dependent methyltransferase [Planctomycetota bacterium]